MPVTDIWEIPFPAAGDSPDGPAQIQALAEWLDANENGSVAMQDQGTLANLPTSSVAEPGKRGRRYLVVGDPDPTNNGRELVDTGTSWVEIFGHIPNGSVVNASLADNAVDARVIAPDAVGQSELAPNSVGSPELIDGSVGGAEIANSLKPSAGAANGDEALRGLGTDAGEALPGNDVSVTNTRVPTDGSVTDAKVAAAAAIAESKLALATDAVAGTGSRRTLGTGGQQAMAGNDVRVGQREDALQQGAVLPADLAPSTIGGAGAMQTRVAPGAFWITSPGGVLTRHVLAANWDSGNHPANPGGNPRIDSIVATYNTWGGVPTLSVVQGNAIAGAQINAPGGANYRQGAPGGPGGTALPANSVVIRDVLMNAGAAAGNIAAANDRRPWAKGGHWTSDPTDGSASGLVNFNYRGDSLTPFNIEVSPGAQLLWRFSGTFLKDAGAAGANWTLSPKVDNAVYNGAADRWNVCGGQGGNAYRSGVMQELPLVEAPPAAGRHLIGAEIALNGTGSNSRYDRVVVEIIERPGGFTPRQ